jgi:hypothetical protein
VNMWTGLKWQRIGTRDRNEPTQLHVLGVPLWVTLTRERETSVREEVRSKSEVEVPCPPARRLASQGFCLETQPNRLYPTFTCSVRLRK